MTKATAKPRSKGKPKKVEWKDALAAIEAKGEQHQRLNQRWGQMYKKARADLQSEEAILFLGEDARKVLQQQATPTDTPTSTPTARRPPKNVAVLGGGVALVTLAGYAYSLWRVARVFVP